MPDDQNSRPRTDEEQMAHVEELLKPLLDEKEKIAQRLGKSSSTDIGTRHRQEDEAAALFARMSPAERTELYINDKEQWSKLLEATRDQGMRKLLGWR